MNIRINHRITGSLLLEGEFGSIKGALEAAVSKGADLNGADLRGKKLIGERPVFVIGPIGSRAAQLTTYITGSGIYVSAGCFFGTMEEFREAVSTTHKDNDHGREYEAAILLIERHAELWTPTEGNGGAA